MEIHQILQNEEIFSSVKLRNGLKSMTKGLKISGGLMIMSLLPISLIHLLSTQLDTVRKKKDIISLIQLLFLKTTLLEMESFLTQHSILFIKNMIINVHVVMDICFQKIRLNVYHVMKFTINVLNVKLLKLDLFQNQFVLNVELV